MTATVDDAIEKRGGELGAAGFVTKPFTKQALLDSVKDRIS